LFCFEQASSDRKQIDIGANLFIGSLDPNVDERLLYDTFSAFGTLVQTAKVCAPPKPFNTNPKQKQKLKAFFFADRPQPERRHLQRLRLHPI